MLLKKDLFGTVSRASSGTQAVVIRDTREARWWLRPLARRLARREANALERLRDVEGIPHLLAFDGRQLSREWLDGEPMHRAKPTDPHYFFLAFKLLCRLHARRVVHNDLAKETNWLVSPEGHPALVDFQLAAHSRARGMLFRLMAHDDLRHLLKHKRSYVPERLTARERRILARPSMLSRAWRATGKRIYLFVTRRILRWSDREGAGDRLHDPGQTR